MNLKNLTLKKKKKNWNLYNLPPGYPWVPKKNVSQISPAVWPGIADIYVWAGIADIYVWPGIANIYVYMYI